MFFSLLTSSSLWVLLVFNDEFQSEILLLLLFGFGYVDSVMNFVLRVFVIVSDFSLFFGFCGLLMRNSCSENVIVVVIFGLDLFEGFNKFEVMQAGSYVTSACSLWF